jgi:hypothetical protein
MAFDGLQRRTIDAARESTVLRRIRARNGRTAEDANDRIVSEEHERSAHHLRRLTV